MTPLMKNREQLFFSNKLFFSTLFMNFHLLKRNLPLPIFKYIRFFLSPRMDASLYSLSSLEKKIGYTFRRPKLLVQALTHSSIGFEKKDSTLDNERLEFLGDAVLQLIITEYLFKEYPDLHEGELTKIRTGLVSGTALKTYALQLNIGEHLIMSRGEEANGGRKRSSIISDSFEALIAAIFLDGGIKAARSFVLKQTRDHLQHIVKLPTEINPKGHLQELLQSSQSSAPIYELIKESGAAHQKKFHCRVLWEGRELGTGEGRSKKAAEIVAATEALKTLKKEQID